MLGSRMTPSPLMMASISSAVSLTPVMATTSARCISTSIVPVVLAAVGAHIRLLPRRRKIAGVRLCPWIWLLSSRLDRIVIAGVADVFSTVATRRIRPAMLGMMFGV